MVEEEVPICELEREIIIGEEYADKGFVQDPMDCTKNPHWCKEDNDVDANRRPVKSLTKDMGVEDQQEGEVMMLRSSKEVMRSSDLI